MIDWFQWTCTFTMLTVTQNYGGFQKTLKPITYSEKSTTLACPVDCEYRRISGWCFQETCLRLQATCTANIW